MIYAPFAYKMMHFEMFDIICINWWKFTLKYDKIHKKVSLVT